MNVEALSRKAAVPENDRPDVSFVRPSTLSKKVFLTMQSRKGWGNLQSLLTGWQSLDSLLKVIIGKWMPLAACKSEPIYWCNGVGLSNSGFHIFAAVQSKHKTWLCRAAISKVAATCLKSIFIWLWRDIRRQVLIWTSAAVCAAPCAQPWVGQWKAWRLEDLHSLSSAAANGSSLWWTQACESAGTAWPTDPALRPYVSPLADLMSCE